jgi:hypothetical protein
LFLYIAISESKLIRYADRKRKKKRFNQRKSAGLMSKKLLYTGKLTGDSLFNELAQLIEESQRQLVSAANSTLTMLFWQIGHRINENILQNKRADYGKQIVVTLSRQLEAQYGSNF